MQFKTLAILAAAAGHATATLDLLTGRPLSEALFGLTPAQVKSVDNRIARAEANSMAMFAQAYSNAGKSLVKIITEVDKSSAPAFNDAAAAVSKALTPDVRAKIKKAITTIVDSTLAAAL
ncbi:hypothetical protein FBU59_005342 [Linderina macrospora]|uniref:Uncharacterized protein n=1 Tax=Linderina macrospora TaxID=4868 RepID=A0ACC1J351_9FUNG|nr:hypothetical protein FBU59_005342 [Linderina macrospora]